MIAVGPILLGALLTILTAWALGRVLLRSLRLNLYRLEEDLLAWLAGSACLSGVVLLLGCFHLARTGAFVAVCVVSLGIAYWRGALHPARQKLPALSRLWLLLFCVPFAVYGVLYFCNALAPEASPNGSSIYLGGVMRTWHDQGFAPDAGVPQGLGMLFLFAFSIGKHSAAALVHFTFLAALPCLMLSYGRRFRMARPFLLGAMLVYLSPIAGIAGTSAYYDLACASVLFGLFYALQIWDESRNPRLLVLAGVLALFGGVLIWGAVPPVLHLPIRRLPAGWSLSGLEVQGLFGPWLLLTPIALLAVRWKQGRRLLLAAAVCAIPIFIDNSTRLLLPASVFVAAAIGLAVQNSPGILPALLLLQCFVSWPSSVATFAAENAWRITGMPVDVALRRIPENEFLRHKLPGYGVARAIEEHVPTTAHVLMLVNAPQAYIDRRVWLAGADDGKRALQAMQSAYRSVAFPLEELRFSFPEQPLRALRVIRTGRASDAWSVFEMRVYRANAEIARQPAWRVSAHPDAFDAPRAFDNSEVTAWPAWQVAEPGMYLEENFAGTIHADSVLLLSSAGAALRLEGLSVDGHWQTLAAQFDIAMHSTPAGLRQAAIDELKSLGFGYLVSQNDGALGIDLRIYASYWGITCLHEVEGACVYRLD
jgi:hypothetical protein